METNRQSSGDPNVVDGQHSYLLSQRSQVRDQQINLTDVGSRSSSHNIGTSNGQSVVGDIEIKSNPLMLSPGGQIRATSDRTFYDRTFSKLGKGSLRGSIFSLCASAIGSGVLSLPYVLRLCGYIEGTLFMILGATAAQVSLKMLAGLACDHNLPNYSQIAIKAADGKQSLNLVLSGMIMLFMFGSCISYQIIITTLL